MKPPRKTAWQVKPGANGTWLVRCRHGNEKTNHGEAFALYLWAVSHGTAQVPRAALRGAQGAQGTGSALAAPRPAQPILAPDASGLRSAPAVRGKV